MNVFWTEIDKQSTVNLLNRVMSVVQLLVEDPLGAISLTRPQYMEVNVFVF